MADNCPSYPRIDPVPQFVARPLWSVMIPTYNSVDYLPATLASVLDQLPPDAAQVEVVDDCSGKVDSRAVVNQWGRGRVAYYSQPLNVGPQANFTTCVQRAVGHWVHILHDDDMVLPGFYASAEAAAD